MFELLEMNQADLFGSTEPLPEPSAELVRLAQRLPSLVRFGTSTWTYDGWFGDVYHRRYRGAQPAKRLDQGKGDRNPDFLNADLFKDGVLRPYTREFQDHVGCFVFEFQAMRGKDLPHPLEWADALDTFLAALPRDFRYAVELRNAELL